jgi:hypothetical protein
MRFLLSGAPVVHDLADASGTEGPLLSVATERTASRAGPPSGEGLGDERVHTGEVATDVLSAVHHEGGITMEPAEQRPEESLHGGRVHEPHRDTGSESLRKPTGPSGKRMELSGEIVREAAIELFSMHLLSQPGDLPGYFAMLSVLVVSRDVGDDFNTNRLATGVCCHARPWLSRLT